MPEAVPSLNVPPPFELEPEPVAVVAKISAAIARGTAASHFLLI
jgi:hypothetical protein